MDCIRHQDPHSKPEPLTIDPSRLPRLPDLPPELATRPFTHKSHLLAQKGVCPDAEQCELDCYNRDETMGDALIYMWTTDWLITQHRTVDSGVTAAMRALIVNNGNLGKLSRHYKLHERALVKFKLRDDDSTEEAHKIHADLYEAYIGAVWQASRQGSLPMDTLQRYFHSLFTDGAYPDLERRLAEYQRETRTKRKARVTDRASKRQKKKNVPPCH